MAAVRPRRTAYSTVRLSVARWPLIRTQVPRPLSYYLATQLIEHYSKNDAKGPAHFFTHFSRDNNANSSSAKEHALPTFLQLCKLFKNQIISTIFKVSTTLFPSMPLPSDLLYPSADDERAKHKLKRLVQHPNSNFTKVKCPSPSCSRIATVFSHSQTVVQCPGCQAVLCQPTGGRARLTEGCRFRNPMM